MSTKTIEDLRDRLFAAMDGIKDGSVTMEQAQTIMGIGQVIVNTAKVECDVNRITQRRESRFMGVHDEPGETRRQLPSGVLSITRHVMGDE
jgi:hypothetical protein